MKDMNDSEHKGVCARCEVLPTMLPDEGVLYIAPPIIHTGVEIMGYLRESGMHFEETYEGVFGVSFTRQSLTEFSNEYLSRISAMELKDTKSLVLPAGEALEVRHLTQMQPLQSVVALVQGEWLVDLLRAGGIRTHFQPIVSAADPTSVHAYECLARGANPKGGLYPPGRMFSVATEADMLFNLDRACRMSAIRSSVQHGLQGKIFVNFNPTTIYTPEYCLKTTLAAIEEARLEPDRIVFEVVESDEIRDVDHLLEILHFYREHGFGVALDDLGAGFSSLNLLTRLRPDYIKLDMQLIRSVDSDSYKSVITDNLLSMANELEVHTIAEGVETVEEWRWLTEHGAEFVQGFLFARPDAPPPEVAVPA